MDWQYPLTLTIIGIAAIAFGIHLVKFVRSLITGVGCGSGCGKCRPAASNKMQGRVQLPLARSD